MTYGSPAPFVAFVLAMVSGTVLALGHYIAGGILGVLAVLIFGLWRYAEQRGDDARHELW
jgi:hypothetical protein